MFCEMFVRKLERVERRPVLERLEREREPRRCR